MKFTLEQIYHAIGQSIVDSADSEWDTAVLRIDYQIGMVSYNLNFYTGNDSKSVKFRRHPEMTEMIMEMHKITTQEHNAKWNRLKFTLTPQGKFHLNFIWDQEWQNEVDKFNK